MIVYKFLRIDENKKEICYVGYPLCVSPSEFGILKLLAECGSLSADELSAMLGLDENKRGNIAAHICRINKKAYEIGERKLILFGNKKYSLNEYM